MTKFPGLILLIGVLLWLTGCSGTGRFVDNPTLKVVGPEAENLLLDDVVESLFTGVPAPYRIQFCEADPQTQQCTGEDDYPTATGLGGFFLPLTMAFRAMDIEEIGREEDQLRFRSRLDSPVNNLQPACGTVDGSVVVPSAETATMSLPSFFCNWAAIGNVVTNATFSIDSIRPEDRSFTGYYKLSFYGTGNASGSGYYRAVIRPAP